MTTIGLTSSSRRSAGTQASATARNRSTTSTSCGIGSRGGRPRCSSVASRTAVAWRRMPGISSRRVSRGERIAISWPGRRSAATASASIPPAPTLTIGPRSAVQRADTSRDPPRPGSWSTNDATRKPSTSRPARPSRIPAIASPMAEASRGTIATPPTSVLWAMAGETTRTTTRSPWRVAAARSISSAGAAAAPSTGMSTARGTATPMASRIARASGSGSVAPAPPGLSRARAPSTIARIRATSGPDRSGAPIAHRVRRAGAGATALAGRGAGRWGRGSRPDSRTKTDRRAVGPPIRGALASSAEEGGSPLR